jgi:hypothetical protein
MATMNPNLGEDVNVVLELGTRVRMRHDVDRWPNFVVPVGYEGVVTTIVVDQHDVMVGVQMDLPIPGCEPWDNEVQWVDQHHGLIGENVEVI